MDNNGLIESPVVSGGKARAVDALNSDYIIRRYKEAYQIDVSNYFTGVDVVRIYECQSTTYRFYHPFALAGKGELYRQLEVTNDGKYKDDKWEFRRALDYICPSSSRVLDVGCGKGAFLKLARQAGLDASGIELNTDSVAEAKQNGLNVYAETIKEHIAAKRESYDAVCSFQVLEHVPHVREFIQDCITALKPGGLLIFGVPNNDGFVGRCRAVLNMPPHHMGLWTRSSLTALEHAFALDLTAVELEPLAEFDWYAAVTEQRRIRNRFVLSIYYRSGLATLYRKWVKARRNYIPGHTIMAIYKRRK